MQYDSVLKKILKYIIMFLAIFVSCTYIPQNHLADNEIVIISSIVTVVYAFMETYFPTLRIDNFK